MSSLESSRLDNERTTAKASSFRERRRERERERERNESALFLLFLHRVAGRMSTISIVRKKEFNSKIKNDF